MSDPQGILRRGLHTLAVVLVTALPCPTANAALAVMDTKYHPGLTRAALSTRAPQKRFGLVLVVGVKPEGCRGDRSVN